MFSRITSCISYVWFNLTFIYCFILCSSSLASVNPDQILDVNSTGYNPLKHEAILRIEYSLDCDFVRTRKSETVNGIIELPGRTKQNDRKIQLHFNENNKYLTVVLGNVPPDLKPELKVNYKVGCEFKEFKAVISYEPRQPLYWNEYALVHSPYLVLREDQQSRAVSDQLLAVEYTIEELENHHIVIRYYAYFTDQDSKKTKKEKDVHMELTGTKLHIDWVYAVEFDKKQKVVQKYYRSGFALVATEAHLDHYTRIFSGSFIPGTKHPILYISGNNNIFSDKPSSKQTNNLIGYHPYPSSEISEFKTPDWIPLSYGKTWFLDASEAELIDESKLSNSNESYLYILVIGQIKKGALRFAVEFSNGQRFESESSINTIGKGTRDQRFVALPVGKTNVENLLLGKTQGRFKVIDDSNFLSSLEYKFADIQFYGLKRNGIELELNKIKTISIK